MLPYFKIPEVRDCAEMAGEWRLQHHHCYDGNFVNSFQLAKGGASLGVTQVKMDCESPRLMTTTNTTKATKTTSTTKSFTNSSINLKCHVCILIISCIAVIYKYDLWWIPTSKIWIGKFQRSLCRNLGLAAQLCRNIFCSPPNWRLLPETSNCQFHPG